MIGSIEATVGIYGASFVIAILSGFIPLINAEIYLVAVSVSTQSLPLAIALGFIVALGQMIAKVGIYKTARKASNLRLHEEGSKMARARKLMAKWEGKPHLLTFISATFGIPPFFIVSVVGGMLELPFVQFMTVGFIGRSIRFVTVAVVAVYVKFYSCS